MYKKVIFIICMLLAASWSFADTIRLMDGIEIIASQSNNNDRSSSILASINGHTLTVVFTENLGTVTIEVRNAAGVAIDLNLIGTPVGYECYISQTGHYTVIFKLSNGDEYSGEFDVTN